MKCVKLEKNLGKKLAYTKQKLRGMAGACITDLETFSHNPTHGSFAPLAFQPTTMTNCVNQRFLSY